MDASILTMDIIFRMSVFYKGQLKNNQKLQMPENVFVLK